MGLCICPVLPVTAARRDKLMSCNPEEQSYDALVEMRIVAKR
ncbi:hypothetical protein [Photobacterium frigidiphilum]